MQALSWTGICFRGSFASHLVSEGFPIRDPRAFLYEKKERIRKSQIVTFISRRIRKISKIRPVSKSEKFFFQSLIGVKRLMDLVAA